jgi:hypothetical protein
VISVSKMDESESLISISEGILYSFLFLKQRMSALSRQCICGWVAQAYQEPKDMVAQKELSVVDWS